ncbi:molybdopterin molybdenumtransferase MoeA [Rhodobacterales bacterium HKCCE2091]|nr:molybdopterin molybdenumtransferase MoeA [Rhodobacterales bacterium HKCCE2091]
MISVQEALDHCLALATPLPSETVPLTEARGRVLAEPVAALRDQPPFATSVMDGYALADAAPGARYRVVGEAPAGHGWHGRLGAGEALRIFTGAPIPEGASQVVIQEDVDRSGDEIRLHDDLDDARHVRAAGADFRRGDRIDAPRRMTPALIALAAAMGHANVTVARRPEVAIVATGDELVPPGVTPGPGQITASNHLGLKAMAEAAGACVRLLPIAKDTEDGLAACLRRAAGTDLVVTIGGASVGDHDLVGPVAESLGLERAFYKIAMRPGKPLMAGRMGASVLLGLPGNPVSSMVCGQIFMQPMLAAFQGLPPAPAKPLTARLVTPLPANGPRAHYMRATLSDEGITPADSQDSALLTRLADADALIVRPPHDPPREAGAEVHYLPIPA